MSSSDEESLPEVAPADDLEVILEGEDQPTETGVEEAQEVPADNTNNNEADEEGNKKIVKPKRKIKNPQPKFNEQTLKNPRGLSAIPGYFERVKFKGPGYEEQDLNVVMKTYEYWCHRFFPKFPFDASIARLEKLGSKKATITHVKRIRMGILDDDGQIVNRDDDMADDQVPTDGFVNTVEDPFDQLVSNEPEPEITEEQLEQMRKNKEKAERLRLERLQKIRAQSSQLLESSQISQMDVTEMAGSSSQRAHNESEEADFDQILSIINEGNERNLKELEITSSGNSRDTGNSSQADEINSQSQNQHNEKSDNIEENETSCRRINKILSDSEDEDEGASSRGNSQINYNRKENEEVNFDQILDIVNETSDKTSKESQGANRVVDGNRRKSRQILSDSDDNDDDENNLVIAEDYEDSQDGEINETNEEQISRPKRHNRVLSDDDE